MSRLADAYAAAEAQQIIAHHAATTSNPTRMIGVPICPDLLDYSALGAADNLRGRVVRGFFWLLRAWPT